ncbi:50S ribosomal protein L33 [Aquibacillus salsiterrae]|uniref:Large ribosomal subunit protein bL33 n=1 Tax=Aquibacillus salsiterrae TaxID=2950439 RepID=A0A9X3WHY0_9BACI|nr:50S ribosomal protein L33 [Aquibacillus salsiterrae]MDC3417779.1 50S ribosomal protein L33 [Aquibacillus salsiterrae]
MGIKITLACSECLSRNYSTTKNPKINAERLEVNKYCKRCGGYTIHRETK